MVKTFVYLWGLLGLIFVRNSQTPTEQRELGVWVSASPYISRRVLANQSKIGASRLQK